MKPLSLFFIATFLSYYNSAYAQNDDNSFDINKDNYYLKTSVSKDQGFGFTIEYHNYYKVVTNLQTSRSYCLIGWNQTIPEECNSLYSFQTPIQLFSVDTGYDTVMPFIELLGIQDQVVKTNTSQVTSPCFKDGSLDTSTLVPAMTLSSRTSGGNYVDFSADDDNLTPLQKAGWLMYLGAFFDLEETSVSVYNQLANNYACHKNNVAAISTSVPIAWTTYDPALKLYTVRREIYYTQLVKDAGGSLAPINVAQSNLFNMSVFVDHQRLAQALHGAKYIIDGSATQVEYTSYLAGNDLFSANNRYNVTALLENQVFSTNGLVNSNNVSDWSQRGVARPDLALLELIQFMYPAFEFTNKNMFPIWLKSWDTIDANRRVMTPEIYGGCSNISYTAFVQSQCIFGANSNSGNVLNKKLSSGDKAGISVGTVAFVIIALLVGIWAFRKYQRRRRRHNFYRMNDL